MLNVKYIVDLNENNALGLRLNEENLGNAWFIENIINVNNSNEEILFLDDLNYSRDCLSKDLPNKKFNISITKTCFIKIKLFKNLQKRTKFYYL